VTKILQYLLYKQKSMIESNTKRP